MKIRNLKRLRLSLAPLSAIADKTYREVSKKIGEPLVTRVQLQLECAVNKLHRNPLRDRLLSQLLSIQTIGAARPPRKLKPWKQNHEKYQSTDISR